MSSTTTSAIFYDNKSQTNYKSWNRSILRKFDSHPDKLLPVVTVGTLDIMYKAKFRNAVYKAKYLNMTNLESAGVCNKLYHHH